MNKDIRCEGTHDVFVAEVVAVEATGKVYILTVCKACDKASCHPFQVSDDRTPLRLLKEEKREI
jgi:hypothetical protein